MCNKTKIVISYSSFFKENMTRNYFSNIPDDLKSFLEAQDGIMQPVVDNLQPSKRYEIKISIKSIK